MTRKIIQIAAFQKDYPTIVVLCDDGTVWRRSDYDPRWQQLPPLPQDELPIKTPPEAA